MPARFWDCPSHWIGKKSRRQCTRKSIVISPRYVGECSRERNSVAVVIRKRMLGGGVGGELKTYQPTGRLDKRDRERANDLDKGLAVRIPQLADAVATGGEGEDGLGCKRYVLG